MCFCSAAQEDLEEGGEELKLIALWEGFLCFNLVRVFGVDLRFRIGVCGLVS